MQKHLQATDRDGLARVAWQGDNGKASTQQVEKPGIEL